MSNTKSLVKIFELLRQADNPLSLNDLSKAANKGHRTVVDVVETLHYLGLVNKASNGQINLVWLRRRH